MKHMLCPRDEESDAKESYRGINRSRNVTRETTTKRERERERGGERERERERETPAFDADAETRAFRRFLGIISC
jgi:hypothetical protein